MTRCSALSSSVGLTAGALDISVLSAFLVVDSGLLTNERSLKYHIHMLNAHTANREEQRQRILAAAAKFIASEGYHGMTMRKLAQATGRSLASAYNYFSSKEEILFALQEEAFRKLISATEASLKGVESANGQLNVLILTHLTYFSQNTEVMRVLLHEAGSLPAAERDRIRALKTRYFDLGCEVTARVIRQGCGRTGGEGEPASDVEIEKLTYCLFGMLNWVHGWYRPERHGDLPELARTVHRLFLCGAVTRCPEQDLVAEVELKITPTLPPLLGPEPRIPPA